MKRVTSASVSAAHVCDLQAVYIHQKCTKSLLLVSPSVITNMQTAKKLLKSEL